MLDLLFGLVHALIGCHNGLGLVFIAVLPRQNGTVQGIAHGFAHGAYHFVQIFQFLFVSGSYFHGPSPFFSQNGR